MDKIAQLLTEAAELSKSAAALASAGEVNQALSLESRADRLRQRAREEAQRRQHGGPGNRGSALGKSPRMPVRQCTIAALNEIGVPASPRLVSDYSLARFGLAIRPRAYAALRRDERRAWASAASHRPVHIVPALEGRFFSPMRGRLTLSDWSLSRRIVGPWSERVDYLQATINMARQLQWMQESVGDQQSRDLAEMLRAHASTIPGAFLEDKGVDPLRVEDAARAELSNFADDDERWRRDAAERATSLLATEELRLWGATPPDLVQRDVG